LTANKGPVVHAYDRLSALAKQNERNFLFESTVMDGAPVFGVFRCALPGANLISFSGVLNSTTNMILTRMEKGESFEEAVIYCQKIGIAETDPSGDVDGWDAAIKVAALATVLMKRPVKPEEIEREGIRGITSHQIARARDQNKRWKLVCRARLVDDRIEAKVAPEMVGVDSPLYSIDGTSSAVQFQTDVLGRLTLIEDNPGPHTTAYGLLADFINAVR
jgi:homoserine dehydrogenase